MKTEWLFSAYSSSVVLKKLRPPLPRAVRLYLPGPSSPIYVYYLCSVKTQPSKNKTHTRIFNTNLKFDDLRRIRVDSGALTVANRSATVLQSFDCDNQIGHAGNAVQTDGYVVV